MAFNQIQTQPQDPSLKGSNLTKVRGYNESLILHLVRTNTCLTKADATRVTGLSANAVSVIFRALESEGFLLKCDPVRGRVGQPSVPMRLNPNVRHYIGLQLGRRRYVLVLIDFTGNILSKIEKIHNYPTPRNLMEFIDHSLAKLLKSAERDSEQIFAFNVAAPFDLWNWTHEINAPQGVMDEWRSFDIKAQLQGRLPWKVTVENDGTAACRAEHVFGRRHSAQDWVYFFVDNLIGGGIVLNGSVYPGRKGKAGGFGPLRVPEESGGNRLIDHASLVVLERMTAEDVNENLWHIYSSESHWSSLEAYIDPWLKRSGRSIAHAIISSLAVIDFNEIVIDGAFPSFIRERLVVEVTSQILMLDLQGIDVPEIVPGTFGSVASALGAAAIQISGDFMIDHNQLIQQNSSIDL